MANVVPSNHVDELPVVEPNQPNDAPVILEHVLVDEDEDPEDAEFKEEEEDMDIDDEEDENEPELMFLMKRRILLTLHHLLLIQSLMMDINTLFGWIASLSGRLCGRETAHAMVKKKRKAKDKYYGKLILDLGNKARSSVEEGAAAMANLVRKPGNAEEKAECKKLKKELEAAHFFERLNEAIDVPVEDEKSPSFESWGSPLCTFDLSCHSVNDQKSADAAIAAERARQANPENNASGSGQAMGAVELQRWFEKTESVFRISEYAEGKKVKFAAATLQGPTLTWWSSKVATLNLETVNQMPWTERNN
nr:hypothetical protein [Tanacetum cinerariifolium]